MNYFLDESDEPLEDDEFPSDDDLFEDDDEALYVTCNHCGADVYEESEVCPECGMYVSSASSPWQGRPAWWIVLGLLGVGAVILVLALSAI